MSDEVTDNAGHVAWREEHARLSARLAAAAATLEAWKHHAAAAEAELAAAVEQHDTWTAALAEHEKAEPENAEAA